MADHDARDLLDIAWFVRPHGLDEPCCGDLSAAEVRALQTAAADCCRTIQDIGRALGVTRSGATRIVDRLERRGLVRRCCATDDRRCTWVETTVAGRATMFEATGRFDALLADLLSPLPAAQRRQIHEALRVLAGRVRAHQQT